LKHAFPELIAAGGILFFSFGMVTGRRSGVHGVEQRVDSAMKYLKFLNKLFRRKKLPTARVFRGGSSEMTKLSWRR
jgi:hypothetical protein